MTSDDFFANIETQLQRELPLVAYRKPNDKKLKYLLQKDHKLHFLADFNERGFVFSPFDDKEKTIIIPLSDSNFKECESLVLYKHAHAETQTEYVGEEKQVHIQLIQNALNAINEGDIHKVVVSRREFISLKDTNPMPLFKKLLERYETAFVYCWYHPNVGLWLGATPETFVNIEGNRIKTMALAATQNFTGSLDVLWQPKEKEEQQIVTNYIIDALTPLVSNLSVSEIKTVKAGNLLHLKTEISALFNNDTFNLTHTIRKLHPTPAVCGLPRDKAKQFILEKENYNREFYTGFLGELNLREKTLRNGGRLNVENDAYRAIKTVTNLYVNLRCFQLKKNHAIVYVGGGITKDSNPEKEWQETLIKSKVIKSIL